MYLARFVIDEREYVQAAATLSFAPLAERSKGSASAWRQQLVSLCSSLANFDPTWIAIRLDFDGQQLARRLLVTTALGRADALRRWMTVLSRLEREASGSVLLAATAEDHDDIFDRRDQQALSISAPVFSHKGTEWIERPIRLFDALDAVFESAMLENRRLGYQAVLTSHRPDAELLHRLRRDQLKLAQLPGFGQSRLEAVREAAERYKSARWLLSETAWLSSPDGETWLDRLLSEASRRLERSAPAFETQGPWEDGAAEGLAPSHLPSAPANLLDAGAAVAGDSLERLLDWNPTTLPSDMFSQPDSDELPDSESTLAEPPDAIKDFLFISYACRDGATVSGVLEQLGQSGLPYWYDQHIQGGSWVRKIEERLERCRAVLLFLSPTSVLSRYVRSEATFAYTLGKPFFLISLEPTDLPAGLRIILSGQQITRIDHPKLIQMIGSFVESSDAPRLK